MHEDSAMRILGYVMLSFKNNSNPAEPLSLHLNFNKNHTSIELNSSFFSNDGEKISKELVRKIETIDPKFDEKRSEPIFVEVTNGKEIPLLIKRDYSELFVDGQGVNDELTFFSIIEKVFSKN